jgi:hypothetical protein
VQRWLGHQKPSFTLDTYVHLLDTDVPQPSFFDELEPINEGNEWATRPAETSRDVEVDEAVEAAV